MGIKASATCQLNFDDADGWLVGAAAQGHAGHVHHDEQRAARRRHPGARRRRDRPTRAPSPTRATACRAARSPGAKHPDKPADPIIVHPDVRRMLLTHARRRPRAAARSSAGSHGARHDAERASATRGAARGRRLRRADDADRQGALHRSRLRDAPTSACRSTAATATSATTAWSSSCAMPASAMIYEGTNGIQALDLVGRKLPATCRPLSARLLPSRGGVHRGAHGRSDIGDHGEGLRRAFGALQLATATIAQKGLRDPEEAGAAATDYLRLFGSVALGFMWARTAKIAQRSCRRPTATPVSTGPSLRPRGSFSTGSCRRPARCSPRSSPAKTR